MPADPVTFPHYKTTKRTQFFPPPHPAPSPKPELEAKKQRNEPNFYPQMGVISRAGRKIEKRRYAVLIPQDVGQDGILCADRQSALPASPRSIPRRVNQQFLTKRTQFFPPPAPAPSFLPSCRRPRDVGQDGILRADWQSASSVCRRSVRPEPAGPTESRPLESAPLSKPCLPIGILAALLFLSCAGIAGATGAESSSDATELTMTVGTGTVIDCPEGIARIAASSPEIVDAVTASNKEVLFHARAIGRATMVIWSRSGPRRTYNVTVEPNLEPMRRLLRTTFPDEKLDVAASQGSLALIGQASSQAVADRALALVAATVKSAINNVKIAPTPEDQVVLRVRFAELDRTAAAQFGVNLLSTGALNTIGNITTGQFASAAVQQIAGANTQFTLSDMLNIFAFRPDLNLGVIIADLQQRGLVQMLAEPNLVASNGKEASFLAGGEIPVPVAQAGAGTGAISVQYREYGIRLTFTPWITPRHTIRIHVKPEVSSLDQADGVTAAGFNIPALTTRRMETDIELGEGQSFVIAGLLDDRVTQNLSQVPGLAHIPILGELFKSRSQNKSKTELIVIVTPSTARPVVGARPDLPWPAPFLGGTKEPTP
jgi:pilus assembly protein CpaC